MHHKAAKAQLTKFNEIPVENKISKLDHLKNPKFEISIFIIIAVR